MKLLNALPDGVDERDLAFGVQVLSFTQLFDVARAACRYVATYTPEWGNKGCELWPESVKQRVIHERRLPGYIGVVTVDTTTKHPDNVYGCDRHWFVIFEENAPEPAAG